MNGAIGGSMRCFMIFHVLPIISGNSGMVAGSNAVEEPNRQSMEDLPSSHDFP